MARQSELDRWITGGLKPKVWPGSQTNRNGVAFLLIDSQTALTFSDIALRATRITDQEKRIRATLIARRAFDSITRLRQRIYFSDPDRTILDTNMDRLQQELKLLGQSF